VDIGGLKDKQDGFPLEKQTEPVASTRLKTFPLA
jgi:hypothetical protein